jgi:hypothetical protein
MDAQPHYGGEPPQFRAGVQPVELIVALGLDFLEGNVIKYVCRWRRKDGLRDLYKARQYLDWLITESERAVPPVQGPDAPASAVRARGDVRGMS